MRLMKAALVLGIAMTLAGSAWACGSNQNAKADTKTKTAQTSQPVKASKPGG